MCIIGSWSWAFTILRGNKDVSLEIYFFIKGNKEGEIIQFKLIEIQDESNFCLDYSFNNVMISKYVRVHEYGSKNQLNCSRTVIGPGRK